MKRAFVVLAQEARLPLAEFLGRRLDCPLASARDAVRAGSVHVAGRRCAVPGRRLETGERITYYQLAAVAEPEPELPILYEDADVVVVCKPAGVPTTATRQAAANALDARLRKAGRPQLAALHRLDLEASGLVILSCRKRAHAGLAAQLASHKAKREYLALVAGPVGVLQGSWNAPVAGKPARTRFRLQERMEAATLLALSLETGRTHQIRVHAAAAGNPLVGDGRHGGPPEGRLMLHAYRLELAHPVSGVPLAFEVAPPADFVTILSRWRLLPAAPAALPRASSRLRGRPPGRSRARR